MFRYYSLGGDTATPSRLYAWLCHAFLVLDSADGEASFISDCVSHVYILFINLPHPSLHTMYFSLHSSETVHVYRTSVQCICQLLDCSRRTVVDGG